MAPETLPALRCESRRPRPEARWGLIAAVVVLMASTVDALWLIPSQQQQLARPADPLGVRYRCVERAAPPATRAPTPSPLLSETGDLRVDNVYLIAAPRR